MWYRSAAGETTVVCRRLNEPLYLKVAQRHFQVGRPEGMQRANELRAQAGLPPLADAMTLALPGDLGTVGQHTVKQLLDKYRAMLDAGQIGADDKRAQLIRALELKSALVNGYELLPYVELPDGAGGDHTERHMGEPLRMSGLDVRELTNVNMLDERIARLFADAEIRVDHDAALATSLRALGNDARDAHAAQLFATLTGDPATGANPYLDMLGQLRAEGLGFEAERTMQRDLAALQLLSPDKAQAARLQLNINARAADLQALINDPRALDAATVTLALKDSANVLVEILRSTGAVTRQASQIKVDSLMLLNQLKADEKLAASLGAVLREAMTPPEQGPSNWLERVKLSPEQFDAAAASAGLSDADKLKAKAWIVRAQEKGFWGTVSGGAAMASFGYKVSRGAFASGSTAMERWGAARDLVSFLSVTSHMSKLGATILDQMSSMVSASAEADTVWKFLGLDRTMPQVWGKTSLLPIDLSNGFPRFWTRFEDDAVRILGDTKTPLFDEAHELIKNAYVKANPNTPPEALGRLPQRIAVSTLKVLGTVSDLAGFADIVTGALGLKQAIASDDTAGIVVNSLTIASGTALAAAGMIGTTSLLTALPAAVTALAGPLFLAGAVLGVGVLIVGLVIGNLSYQRQMQRATEGQTDWWRAYANDGLLQGDWFDKLEYYRYAFFVYGNDNLEPHQSYLQFHAAEWDHFRNKPQEQGTSWFRLDRSLHTSNALTNDPGNWAGPIPLP